MALNDRMPFFPLAVRCAVAGLLLLSVPGLRGQAVANPEPPDVDALTAEVMDGWHRLEAWWKDGKREAFAQLVAADAVVQPSGLPPRKKEGRPGAKQLPGGLLGVA